MIRFFKNGVDPKVDYVTSINYQLQEELALRELDQEWDQIKADVKAKGGWIEYLSTMVIIHMPAGTEIEILW